MYELIVYKSITEVKKDDWNSLLNKNEIICDYDFLQVVEKSNINDCEYYYITVKKDKKIIAHTVVYTMSMDLATFSKGIFKKIIYLIRKLIKNFLIIKVTECGSPIALGKMISINYTEEIDRIEVLKIIINFMNKIGKKNNAKLIVVRDFYKKDYKISEELTSIGLNKTYNLPDVYLNVNWKSFNDYLYRLRYNYRRFLKKCINTIKSEHINIEIIENYEKYVPQIRKLYYNCYSNAKEYRRELITEDFFYNSYKILGKRTKILALKKDDVIIGFGYLLLDDEILRILFVGMDYRIKDKYLTYFNIFFQCLKYGIENKYKKIELGVTTYEFKLKLGGEIISLYAYIKHLNPLLNFILKKFNRLLFPKKEFEERHPFKKE